MLYFSKAKQDPDKIDLDQIAKLREFKKKTFPNALIESYLDITEFKDKLGKQLEIRLRELIAEQSDGGKEETYVRPVTDIVFHFADAENGNDAGTELKIDTMFIEITNFGQLPGFLPNGENPLWKNIRKE